MKRYYYCLLGALAISICDSPAGAGARESNPVEILDGGSAGTPSADGSQGSARRSSDNVQYIGCNINGTTVNCYARTAAGRSLACTTTSPLIAAAVRAVDSSSFLAFTVATNLTTCINTVVDNYSTMPPK